MTRLAFALVALLLSLGPASALAQQSEVQFITARFERYIDALRRQARRLSQRIKGGITSRLAHLDPEKLKKVLIACGVTVAAAAVICLLVKLTPLIVALLAVLGLGVVLQMWNRLRTRMPA